MRYAIVVRTTAKVDNVTEWNGAEWTPPAGTIVIPVGPTDPVQIGDDFDIATGTFNRPIEEMPAGDPPVDPQE